MISMAPRFQDSFFHQFGRQGAERGKANFTDEYECDAVVQITERGHSVAEVAKRQEISIYSL